MARKKQKNPIPTADAIPDIVIITGGLGPTADDITKPTLCEFFGAKLVVDQWALENVKNILGDKISFSETNTMR